MAAVHGEASLCEHREVVRVESMQVRAVHRHDRPTCVGEDGAAPHVFPARKVGRGDQWLQRIEVDALDPAEWGRPGEGSHGAAHVPLARVPLDGHHVPTAVVNRGDGGSAARRVETAGSCLLTAVPAAFHRP